MPRTTDETLTFHVWLPDGRSLCDRRAPRWIRQDASEEELQAEQREQDQAPTCSACLLLVGKLRSEAAVLLKLAGGRIFPESPTLAWQSLLNTRWPARLDLEEFLATPDLDDSVAIDAFLYAIDEDLVDRQVQDAIAAREDRPGRRFDPTELTDAELHSAMAEALARKIRVEQ